MRNVIFAIDITLDGCCDHTKMIPADEIPNILPASCGMLIYPCLAVKPIN